ncbi:hypothetical protein Acr_03g0018890 [Actinidia rufa]|uniref:Uncharacterized protein n=1 Tax=Actinidia rufa TaxID=165716 RepID=A0A7J0EF77_9ERIC|nr:hypothetical protein Acr_03g0018890 [Actinidia rufa]
MGCEEKKAIELNLRVSIFLFDPILPSSFLPEEIELHNYYDSSVSDRLHEESTGNRSSNCSINCHRDLQSSLRTMKDGADIGGHSMNATLYASTSLGSSKGQEKTSSPGELKDDVAPAKPQGATQSARSRGRPVLHHPLQSVEVLLLLLAVLAYHQARQWVHCLQGKVNPESPCEGIQTQSKCKEFHPISNSLKACFSSG